MIGEPAVDHKARGGVTMLSTGSLSEQGIAAGILILSAVLTSIGITLWMGRNLYDWTIASGPSYLGWERGSIMAAMVATLLGVVLLERLLQAAGNPAAARLGLILLLVATALGLTWEAAVIGRAGDNQSLIATYVVLALLGQAALGLALLQTGLLAPWVGWVTIVWSLGWLAALPILSTGDLYYPVLHMVVPLLIGIALLAKR